MAIFGMTTEEELASAMAIANCIQGAIPKDSNGGQVMWAMAVLIAVGAKGNMHPDDFQGVMDEVCEAMTDVFEGRVVMKFVKEH
jgi:hypothetical protein